MTHEIAKRDIEQLPVKSMTDLSLVGQAMAQSGMFGVNNDAAGLVVAMTCYQEKISLMDFKRTYHIVENTPSMRADAMLAKFCEIGGEYKIISKTSEKAEMSMKLNDREYSDSFTWEEAKEEPFPYKKDGKALKKNWATPRAKKQMLWARLLSDMIRTIAPQVVAGVYTPEETEDFTDTAAAPKKEVTVDPEKANKSLKDKKAPKKATKAKDDVIDVTAKEVKEETKPDSQGDKLFDAAAKKTAENGKTDFTVCPISKSEKFYNVPWAKFEELSHLESCLSAKDKYPEITAGHIAELEKEIAKRKTEKAGA